MGSCRLFLLVADDDGMLGMWIIPFRLPVCGVQCQSSSFVTR